MCDLHTSRHAEAGDHGPSGYVSGRVLLGVSQGDSYLRGRVVGLDAKTGRELWRFVVVPNPGEPDMTLGPGTTTPGNMAAEQSGWCRQLILI